MKKRLAISVLLITILLSLAPACTTTQSPEKQVNDIKITAQVKSKLASEVQVTTITNVDVNTTNGVVTLTGQVSNEDVKRKAEEIALTVPNVRRVNNQLQVGS